MPRFHNLSDLILMALFSLFALLVLLLGIDSVVRVLVMLPLMFLFPGYALVSAFFARSMFALETRVVFSMALSVAITILGGLVLHFMGIRLIAFSWVLWLLSITLIASAVAVVRRRRSPLTLGRLRPDLNWQQVGILLLSVVVVVVAVMVARDGVLNQPQARFTQLWLLPSANTPGIFEIGIRSDEAERTRYRLVVSQGDTILSQWETIEISPGEQWETQIAVNVTPGEPPPAALEARLYRADTPNTVYRHVSSSPLSQNP